MARLIDADAFFSEFGELDIEPYNNAPTVDAVPARHGKWIYGNDFHWYTASCSKCGYQRRTDIKAFRWNQWNYCPNCGARMMEERDSDHAEEEIL